MSSSLKSNNPLSYLGVNPPNPPNVWYRENRDPDNNLDVKNYNIGDLWINTRAHTAWILLALLNNPGNPSHKTAIWQNLGGAAPGGIGTLTGDAGVPIGPTLGNCEIVGDGVTIATQGVAPSAIQISAIGNPKLETLSGDTGAIVGPTLGNCRIIGDGISIATQGIGPSIIEISAIGNPDFRWVPALNPQPMAINTGYICTNPPGTALSLPLVAPVGSILRIQGYRAQWILTTTLPAQRIYFEATNFTNIQINSTEAFDSIDLVCVVANLYWAVNTMKGNILVV